MYSIDRALERIGSKNRNEPCVAQRGLRSQTTADSHQKTKRHKHFRTFDLAADSYHWPLLLVGLRVFCG